MENYIHNDTVILVTSYCGGNYSTEKQIMTEVLCKKLKSQGFFVCLATHSILSESIQELVDFYIYDKDNSFSVRNVKTANHGVAEFTSIHNALGAIKRFEFKNVFKVAYDTNPNIDFLKVLEKCKSKHHKLVSSRWSSCEPPETVGTLVFFSDIEFFEQSFSFDEAFRFNYVLECAWYQSLYEKSLLGDVYRYNTYEEFLEIDKIEYAHFGGKGMSEGYPDLRLPQGTSILTNEM